MTILGYDIDGQPLRAGDRVVIVNVLNPVYSDMRSHSVSIVGLDEKSRELITDVEPRSGGYQVTVPGRLVRKLPPKQSDNETTAWESIEQLTGWVPEGVRV